MSGPSPERPVLLVARDLFFRARLEALVRAAGRAPVSSGEAELAVVELVDVGSVARVRALTGAGTAVLAFGAHVRADLLRAARDAGAVAVPNSRVADVLRQRLAGED